MTLAASPEKLREWQRRSNERQLQRRMEASGDRNSPERSKTSQIGSQRRKAKGPRYNDGPWRGEVMDLHGERCKACGDTSHIEADHVIPKSQDSTARHDVLNGLPLCGAFSRNTPGGCHPKKTAGTLKFRAEWFLPAQLDYLRQKGWVAWNDQGEPFGRGHKHFDPISPQKRNEGERHGKEPIQCW